MMEEKGDDFYGDMGNYQVFKGSGKIYKGHCFFKEDQLLPLDRLLIIVILLSLMALAIEQRRKCP